MGRPNRDRRRGIAWVVDRLHEAGPGLPLLRVELAVAGVARRDDHDHPGAHQAVNLDAERTLPAGKHLSVELVADTKVDPVDTEELAVAVDFLADVL